MEENFWSLFFNLAHWEFELFLMFVFDVLIGIIIWPRLRKWTTHHQSDDQKIQALEKRVSDLETKLSFLSDDVCNDTISLQ